MSRDTGIGSLGGLFKQLLAPQLLDAGADRLEIIGGSLPHQILRAFTKVRQCHSPTGWKAIAHGNRPTPKLPRDYKEVRDRPAPSEKTGYVGGVRFADDVLTRSWKESS
jgi:hypothetical protein